jgi:hypothetical protein
MLDANKTSGSSPGSASPDFPDFVAENHFTLFLLFPRSEAAKAWVSEFLPPDHLTFGQGIVIEANCFWPILEALQNQGYAVVPR